MNKGLFTFLAIMLIQAVQAQNFEDIEWQGKQVPAIMTEVYQSIEITETAIKAKLLEMGFNSKEVKNILFYKGIVLNEIEKEPYDVLIKVERKSKQIKDVSVIHFSMAKNYDQYISLTSNQELIGKMKKFTENFHLWANERALEIEIEEQAARIKSADKKLKELGEEKENLEQKLIKLEEQKTENLKAYEKQKQEVENQKKALEILKEKQKSNTAAKG
ncbi:MAG: hypothetical protein KGP35_06270 [Bacteroidetes bacterium]|nr:hypothetical protein [Bacteroidota bacterium]